VAGRLVTHYGVPDDWDELVPPGRAGVSRTWIDLSLPRLPSAPIVFDLVRDGRVDARLLGAVASAPDDRPRLDAYSIARGASRQAGLATAGPWPWQDHPAGVVHPCLVLLVPNYRTIPFGHRADDYDTLAELLAGIDAWRRESMVRSVAVLYASTSPPAFEKAVRDTGAEVFPMADECVLDVTWQTLDGYIATLPTKRRISVRRELRALDETGIRTEPIRIDSHLEEMLDLRCWLVEKYGGTPDRGKERDYLARLEAGFGAAALTAFGTRKSDALLSFTLFVREGTEWTAVLTGSDYTSADARLGYFATMFYAPAAHTFGCGITRIRYGLGSWTAKRSRGCRLEPLWAAVTVPRHQGVS
jgi:uncharacterized protein